METHNFQRSKERSETPDVIAGIEKALRAQLPGVLAIYPAAKANDMAGIDYWLEFAGGVMRGVDVKMRSRDYEAEGKPGLALETWSNVDAKKVGWSRDPAKLCDYVLFYWHSTERSYLVDFRQLQPLFAREWRNWRSKYGGVIQSNGGGNPYRSECLFMPTRDLAAALYREYTNAPAMAA